MGRPRHDFPWDIVDALMSFPVTEVFIAKYLLKHEGANPVDIQQKDVDAKIKLIQRRIKEKWNMSFVQYREEKKEDWKIELCQLQRKACRDGKPAMLIFMGKQDLGQSDKLEERIDHTTKGHALLSDREIDDRIKKLQEKDNPNKDKQP